jgi:hypothetical protein
MLESRFAISTIVTKHLIVGGNSIFHVIVHAGTKLHGTQKNMDRLGNLLIPLRV